jgi:hypothetical protein
MRKATGLLGALGLVILTAGCVQDSQYATGYSPGYATGYNTAYSPGYGSGYNTAYRPGYNTGYNTAYSPAYTTGYSSRPPVYTTGNTYSPAYRYERDANGDGIPDRYQGRPLRY